MILVTNGCASTRTEYIHVQPDCVVPVEPALPTLPAIVIYNALGKEGYLILEQRDTALVTWALDMQSILKVVCKDE